MTVIDLNQIRGQRTSPDPDCLRHDQYGRPMGIYSFEYQMDGRTWAFMIDAYSYEDAEHRLAAIRRSAALIGQLYSSGPY